MKIEKLALILVVALVLVASPSLLWGQEYPDMSGPGVPPPEFERVGSAGFQFLKIPTNARFAAMGGVTTALSRGDATAALANPASLADVGSVSLALTQNNWIADISYNAGSVAKSFGAIGTFGLQFIYVDYGDMVRTENVPQFDDLGNYEFKVKQATDLGTFGAHDLAIGLSYARNITDRLQFGANIKYVEEKIDDASTGNIALDVGTVYYTGLKTFRVAMLGRNFGPDAEFIEWEERIAFPSAKVKLPMTYVLGGAVDILEGGDNPHLWTLAAEFVHTNDASEKVNVGMEYSFMDFAMLRAGYRFNYDEEGITLGAGLKVHTGSFSFLVNYAYMDFGRLDNVSMFSLGFGF